MDVVLVTITGISLVLVVAMGLVLFKLLRDERQRSDARVALLMAATAASATPASAARFDEPELDVAPEAGEVSHDGLFAQHETASPWRWRLAAAGTLALCVSTVGYLIAATGAPAGAPAAAAGRLPLELLSLRHAEEAGGITISGVVQNPRNAGAVTQVSAVAYVLGPDGRVVGNGRASLDYTTLAPGDESPFVIRVPVAGAVSRYRVGFQGPDNAAIAHVDKRADASAARSTGGVPWVR